MAKSVNNQLKQHTILFVLLAANVLASVLHYVHNVMYFQHYPEPDWLNAQLVDYFWFLMTFIGAAGAYCVLTQRVRIGVRLIVSYGVMNMLSVLHYGVDSDNVMTQTMHLFIWLETLCALFLVGYIATNRAIYQYHTH
ncbi:hypothetical protein [Pseudoalteromonas sp. GB56]